MLCKYVQYPLQKTSLGLGKKRRNFSLRREQLNLVLGSAVPLEMVD